MRHKHKTFKIGKSHAHRKAMIANMLTSLFTHGRIKTTEVKAKELRRWADKMITCAKKGDLSSRRKVISVMRPNFTSEIEAVVVKHLFDDLAPKYKERTGGYTRIIKLNNRRGDGAPVCFIELVEEEIKTKTAPVADEAPVVEAVAEEAPVAEAEEK
ncbi:MAG: 50S ribosomal protein L17 [Lentisphaeraceae bacterium]|nr:50S ribosomal protein L17 [Lentisphaeraceae bacterium]